MVFVFFFAAILSASVFSFAAIVGTEDFDGNKSGWNWDDETAPAQVWTNESGQAITITTESYGSGNRAKIVSGDGKVFLSYGTSGQLTSGTFAYTFDMQLPSEQANWGGFSLSNGRGTGHERLFVGKVNTNPLLLRRVNPTPQLNAYTTDNYNGTYKTYAVVANQDGMFAWAFDLGHELQYEDLYTTPTLQLDANLSTLSENNGIRLGTGGTIYYDNIKMAYSDSTTIASKNDATAVTSLTDIFGAVPIVPCIQEAFSNYEEGALVGQFQQNLGQAPLTKWTGANATVDNSQNLDYPGFSGEQGVLNVSGGDNGAKMTLDFNVMDDWGVMGTDGLIGGDSVTNKILYYGYLLQSADGGSGMGAELYRGANKVLSTSDFGIDDLDTDTHLFVVKLMFGENGDNALLFLDPDMSLSEEEQDLDSVYSLSGENFSFDSIVIRGDSAFTYDELRAAQTWWALSDYNEPSSAVPEPSTWALLALGVVVLFLRKRVRN